MGYAAWSQPSRLFMLKFISDKSENIKIVWHIKPLHSFLCVGCSSTLRLRLLFCVHAVVFNRQTAMINLKAEGQPQQQLRTSALRLILLTHTGKRFKSGRLKRHMRLWPSALEVLAIVAIERPRNLMNQPKIFKYSSQCAVILHSCIMERASGVSIMPNYVT